MLIAHEVGEGSTPRQLLGRMTRLALKVHTTYDANFMKKMRHSGHSATRAKRTHPNKGDRENREKKNDQKSWGEIQFKLFVLKKLENIYYAFFFLL